MAIQFIDNQPLIFIDNSPSGGDCLLGQQEYCTKYNKGDKIYAQWKITPCLEANLICNPNFVNNQPEYSKDPNMEFNSTFWTINAPWSYDSIEHRMQCSGTGVSVGNLRSTLNTLALQNYVYEVSFTIGGGTGGTITPVLGGTVGTSVYLPGNYRQIIFYGTFNHDIRFNTFNYDGWIDNVSVKATILDNNLQDSCWGSTSNPERWNLDYDGCLSKVPGTQDTVSNNFYGFTSNMYVKISIDVSNVTQGSIVVSNNSNNIFSITANGHYEKYFNATSGSIDFYADNLFNGTLCNMNLVSYDQEAHATLVSLSGGPTYNLDSKLSYYEDRLMLDANTNTMQTGCYQLCLEYTCPTYSQIDMASDPTFHQGMPGGDWTIKNQHGTNNQGLDGNGDYLVTMSNGYSQWTIEDNTVCLTGQSFYVMNYNFTTGDLWEAPMYVYATFPGCATQYPIISGGESNTTYTGSFILNCQPTSCGMIIHFYCSNPGDGKRITLANAQITATLETSSFPVNYCSGCINLSQGQTCTLFIGGYCGEDSFGFKFPQGQTYPWRIGARVRAVFINPKYNGELKRYADSEGNIKITKANSNKVYQILIDYVDEASHDWLRTAFLCDTIEIGDITYSGEYYVGVDGDYEPEWPSNLGNFNLAQSRVNVQKRLDVIYNNNAG